MDHQSFAQLLGNYGEFLGSIAVLITLVYLVVQVRQATRQIENTGKHARASQAVSVLQAQYMSPDLARIMAELNFSNYGDYGLSKEDTMKFGAWCHAWMQTEQGSFYLLPDGSHRDLHRAWLAQPAGAEFWRTNRGIYDADFVAYMDEVMTEVESSGVTWEEAFAGSQR